MTKTINQDIKKLNKIPHPKGRKTAQLVKRATKLAARQKVKFQHHVKTNLLGEKVLWFKEHHDGEKEIYTPQLMTELIESYLGRFDEELEQIQLKHSAGQRKGRQHANRQDVINMTLSQEKNEFASCGLEVPDMLNPKQLELLRKWTGELRFLQHLQLARYSKQSLQDWKPKKSVNKLRQSSANLQKEMAKNSEDKKTEHETCDLMEVS